MGRATGTATRVVDGTERLVVLYECDGCRGEIVCPPDAQPRSHLCPACQATARGRYGRVRPPQPFEVPNVRYAAPHVAGYLVAPCWCEARLFYVPDTWIVDGRTATCRAPACREP